MRAAAVLLPAAALLAALLAACGSDDDRVVLSAADAPFVPVLESTELAVGSSRIVLSLLDRDSQPSFPPGTEFRARFFEPTEGGTRFRTEVPLDPIVIGAETYYAARGAPLDQAGDWALAVTAALADGSAQSSPRLPFTVGAESSAPAVGEPAPDVATPTLEDASIDRLSGDPEPLPALYQRSVDQALAAGEAFLIVFATYDRCAGRPACARAVEQAKAIARETGITVIHIEPFGRQQQPAHQALIDATAAEWGIRLEPQFFAVDEGGRIRAHFAVAVTDAELRAALGG